jgi:autotransporter-associated beta strand protein
VSVTNAAGFRADLKTVSSSTNTNFGTLDATNVAAGTSGNLGIFLKNGATNIGAYTNNVAVTFADASTLDGASTNLGSGTVTVTGAIYDHASGSLSTTNVVLQAVHVGYTNSQTNLIGMSNALGFRVAMQTAATNSSNGLSLTGVSGVSNGVSSNATLIFASGQNVGAFSNKIGVVYGDSSPLAGAVTAYGTNILTVSGLVYSGQSTWTAGSGNWTNFSNWDVIGGTPGLDGNLSSNDTATFGTGGGGTVTLGTNARLMAIAFNTTNSYTITNNGIGTGTITMAPGSNQPTITVLAGNHTIYNDMVLSNTVVNYGASNTTLTITGLISGSGGFTKTGSGTTILVSTNTYTGETVILGGKLILSYIPQSSETDGYTLENGTTLEVINTKNYVNTNPITVGSGTGTFANSGTGTTVLAGTITKSGTTLVLVGSNIIITGQITGSGAPGSFNSDVQLGDYKNGEVFKAVVDVGPKEGNNNYTGPTKIWAGSTLRNTANNALPHSTGTTNFTTVELGSTNDSSSITNTYNLNGYNQTVSGIQDAGVAANVITNSRMGTSTLTLNGSHNNYFDTAGGVVAGNLALIRSGTGTIIFGGTHSYSGITLINGGAIMLNGTHSGGGLYTVNTAGTLLGTGTTTAPVTVGNGGTIRPGNGVTPGTLTVGGLSFTGGVLNILLSGSTSSVLAVAGSSDLTGGTVQFNYSGLTTNRYMFLTNSGPVITTTFQNTNNVPRGYKVVYYSNSVWLEGNPYCYAPVGGYVPYAANPNQVSVATALNGFSPALEGSDQCVVIDALNELTTNTSQMQQAFNAISPQFYQSLSTIAFNMANAQYNDLVEQMFGMRVAGSGFSMSGFDAVALEGQGDGADIMDPSKDILRPGADNHWGMFVDMNGIFAQANSGNMLPGYNAESGGVIAGLTYKWSPSFMTGLYSGYQGTYAKYSSYNAGSSVIDNAVRFGLLSTYGDPSGKGFYGDALIGGSYHNYDVTRTISFPGLNRTANSAPGAGELDSMLAAGYNWRKGNWAFGPVSSLQYTYFGMNSFSETGAQSLDYQNLGWNTASMIYNLGANCAYSWQANRNLMVVPQINLAWQHEFLQNPYNISGNLAGSGASVVNTSAAPLRDSVYSGIGVTLEYRDRWHTGFFYNAAFGNNDLTSQNFFWSLGLKF